LNTNVIINFFFEIFYTKNFFDQIFFDQIFDKLTGCLTKFLTSWQVVFALYSLKNNTKNRFEDEQTQLEKVLAEESRSSPRRTSSHEVKKFVVKKCEMFISGFCYSSWLTRAPPFQNQNLARKLCLTHECIISRRGAWYPTLNKLKNNFRF